MKITSAKLLGITLCDTLRFDAHIGNVLKMCSQRIYLYLPQNSYDSRDQGLLRHHLNTVFGHFCAFVLSRIRYAIPHGVVFSQLNRGWPPQSRDPQPKSHIVSDLRTSID